MSIKKLTSGRCYVFIMLVLLELYCTRKKSIKKITNRYIQYDNKVVIDDGGDRRSYARRLASPYRRPRTRSRVNA